MLTKNFSREEMSCKHCGLDGIKDSFMRELQALRDLLGRPVIVTSGYRCKDHPAEKDKPLPGKHCEGIAADICVPGMTPYAVYKLIRSAMPIFRGLGVAPHQNYIHVDIRNTISVVTWSYSKAGKEIKWNGSASTLPRLV